MAWRRSVRAAPHRLLTAAAKTTGHERCRKSVGTAPSASPPSSGASWTSVGNLLVGGSDASTYEHGTHLHRTYASRRQTDTAIAGMCLTGRDGSSPCPMQALTLAPTARPLSMPAPRARPRGVVEEQVTFRASAPLQPVAFEPAHFLDEASGQRRRQRCVGPNQPSARHASGHNEFDTPRAACAQRIDLGIIRRLASEHRLSRVGRRPVQSAEVSQISGAHRLVDQPCQLRGGYGRAGQHLLGVGHACPHRPPWTPQVGEHNQDFRRRPGLSQRPGWRWCDVEARKPDGLRRARSGAWRSAEGSRRRARDSPSS